jgi:DNA repair protein RadA/Sms
MGKCPECETWSSLVETTERPLSGKSSARGALPVEPVSIEMVKCDENDRIYTGIGEFDRVLSGVVAGQAVLLSGEPGIGKSTLLLQAGSSFARNYRVFYINGEESSAQIKIRANRLGLNSSNLFLLNQNRIEALIDAIGTQKPDIIFVDSIQTLYSEKYDSLAGSVVQVRETTFELVNLCKSMDIPLFLVSHITKEGNIAGPKVVEHIVDTVLFLETDNRGYYRILRSLKNRFASTEEIGFFKMDMAGLVGVDDITNAFMMVHEEETSGIAVYPFLEGNRAFPVEVQALCAPTQFNIPRRTADGMELNRLSMLIAIMEKKLKFNLSSHDIYVNITGGLKINDPALDLAVVLAIFSSFKNKPVAMDTICAGEVGLTGEVRPVFGMQRRIAEMERMGFARAVFPFKTDNVKTDGKIKLLPVKNISEGAGVL